MKITVVRLVSFSSTTAIRISKVRACCMLAPSEQRVPWPYACCGACELLQMTWYVSRCVGRPVRKGDRVAQLILERIATPEVQEVEDLEATVRGIGGYGSTGVASA